MSCNTSETFCLACLPNLLIQVRIDCSQPLCIHTRQKKTASRVIAKHAGWGVRVGVGSGIQIQYKKIEGGEHSTSKSYYDLLE